MKILLITGTPARTDTNTGKTLITLFSDFEKDELLQLYFSPESPNTELCSSYYQINEKQMIQSFFGILTNKCGSVIAPSMTGENAKIPEKNALILTKYKGNALVRWGREFIWTITKWKNKSFRCWLENEKPDVIFSIMQDTNGATKAVKWIAEKYHIPVIMFVTDDYYNDAKEEKSMLRKLYYRNRKKVNKELASYCNMLVGCSEQAKEFFLESLKISKGGVLYTPSADAYLAMPYKKQKNQDNVKIRYFGNLGLGRWKILRELGRAVSAINAEQTMNTGCVKAMLEVYSSVTDPDIIEALTIENGCEYKGWVYGKEYLSLLQDADVAVHVESFEEAMIRRTWVSVSTKIADYLGAGKCILAIGSKELASIDHIKDAAYVVDSLDSLRDKVIKLISDAALREEKQKKARELAMKEHDISKIRLEVRRILEEAVVG